MIKLQIKKSDIDNISKQLLMKVEGMTELTRSSTLDQIANAAFVILGKRFMTATDTYSSINRKRMHHIYEWNQVGIPSARLFVIERSLVLNGTMMVSSKFLLSRTPVPVNPQLRNAGNSGKFVSTNHIFKQKAEVMETGRIVSFQAKKTLAFLGNNGIQFVKAGKIINILHPGGIAVKSSFKNFMVDWYEKNTQSIMDSSGLYEKIVQETVLVLSRNNAGINDVKKAVSQVVESISKGMMVIK